MQIKVLFLMVIFNLTCAYSLPNAQGQDKVLKGNCRRQTDECTPNDKCADQPSERCCGRLVCFAEQPGVNKCRLQELADCTAERGYCGVNGADRPCCDGTTCQQTTNGAGNQVFLCLPTPPPSNC
ncbi:uncharacterized protein J3D65DRAFT_635257 [Phyllosticta citribraziliensis]|uniref:Uncharacterized protein n=1 Tax=Phyllosticta citribraziliensis TaxID=989973 RepID=A0ABR1LF99_9PEZI